jgi:hypothetical protein
MLEKYEKPEIITQKMEMNVLRAVCKKATLNEGAYSDDVGGCAATPGCGAPCDLQSNDYS